MAEDIETIKELYKEIKPRLDNYKPNNFSEESDLRFLNQHIKECFEMYEIGEPHTQEICIDSALNYIIEIEEIINARAS